MIEIRPPYLYNPKRVAARLSSLPRTAELIHGGKRDGVVSKAFPTLLMTRREILRILGRADVYPHLDALLSVLERCLESGWDAHQLGARDRDEFASLISDLQVAEHFLLRGCTLSSPLGMALEGAKPDMFVMSGRKGAIVEVFRPRELQAFYSFSTDVSRLLTEADVPLDYQATVDVRCMADLAPEGKLISPRHPIALDEAFQSLGDTPLEAAASRIAALRPSPGEEFSFEWPEANLKIHFAFANIRPSGDEPSRWVSLGGPAHGGYDPVGMLERLMKPIARKAQKRQAGEPGDYTRVLVCDVSDAVVEPHLGDTAPSRIEGYVGVMRRWLEPRVERDYDVIALCRRRGWNRGVELAFCVCGDGADAFTVAEMFGATRTLTG